MSVRLPLAVRGPAGSSRQLTSADLTPLGMFKFPAVNNDTAFSLGLLTGRVVGGTTTLLMSGPIQGSGLTGSDISEYAVPADGALSPDLSGAPTTTKIRGWSNLYTGLDVHVPGQYAVVTGIHYVGNDYGNSTQVVFTFCSSYGASAEFANIGTAVINNNETSSVYGPWGANNWEMTCGQMTPVPASVQSDTGCGPFAVIPQVRGGQNGSPWGTTCLPFASFPAITDPPDPFPLTTHSITYATAIQHDYLHPQARNTNCKRCGSNAPNDTFIGSPTCNCAGGSFISSTFNPWFGGAAPIDTTIDWVHGGAWIHGASKSGFLATGQLAETISIANGFTQNVNYSASSSPCAIDPTNCHQSYGPAQCCHGHIGIGAAVGPRGDTICSYLWIYAESDLVSILKSEMAPYGATPVETTRFALFDPDGFNEAANQINQTIGVWFEPGSKRLYVIEQGRYTENFAPRPVCHVYAVDC